MEEGFTVPVSVALDRHRYQGRAVSRDGQSYTIWSLDWEGYNIWGATAAMLMNLITRLEHSVEPENTGIRSGT